MGRKPLARKTEHINLKLSLRVGDDDDLLVFFAGLAPRRRAAAIKAALRSGQGLAAARLESTDSDEWQAALEDFLE